MTSERKVLCWALAIIVLGLAVVLDALHAVFVGDSGSGWHERVFMITMGLIGICWVVLVWLRRPRL